LLFCDETGLTDLDLDSSVGWLELTGASLVLGCDSLSSEGLGCDWSACDWLSCDWLGCDWLSFEGLSCDWLGCDLGLLKGVTGALSLGAGLRD